MNTKKQHQAKKIIKDIIKSNITESERFILEALFESNLKDREELKELKESDLNVKLLEQKKISKIWIDKYQELKKKYESVLYQTGIKKIEKDPYLSARGERLDW